MKQVNNQHPKKSSFKLFTKKPQAQEIEKHRYSVITTAKSADRPCLTGHSPPLYPTIGYPISPHQSQAPIHQTQAQQQQQINTQTLLPYSGFLPITPPSPTMLIPAPPRAPQPELFNYSNTPQFSNQPIKFANTNKTSSSELPQPIQTVSNINETQHMI